MAEKSRCIILSLCLGASLLACSKEAPEGRRTEPPKAPSAYQLALPLGLHPESTVIPRTTR